MSFIEEAEVVRLPELAQDFEVRPLAASRSAWDITGKRLLDIFGACAALFLSAPVMVLIFLVLSVFGNPVFMQRRVGRGGKLFSCYKFRTMVNGAEQVLAEYLRNNPAAQEEWRRTFKLTHDPRITPLGYFLRKSSLDELPQLFNVLKGDMSLVGPRPIVPAEVPRYASRIRAYHTVRPGLTGLWQVSGRNLVSYRRRVALDTVYAREHSMRLDAVILIKTVGVVLLGRGAL
ncbi:MAG TPA: sugar transferase [Rhizomicrobium sp.]|nr:sugar transferase [Rhizomicrobium sp.]